MLRTLDRRLEALAPPAIDVLLVRFYAACVATFRCLSLREYIALAWDRAPELLAKAMELDRAHGGLALQAQCEALLSPAEVECRMYVLDKADNEQDEPTHPIGRLYRRITDAEVERLCEAGEAFTATLLEIAGGYIDVDAPMGEQGL